MANITTKNVPLLFLPALCGGVVAALPLKPPAKIWLIAAGAALLALLMLSLCMYELLRKAALRPAVSLACLCFACGFGILAVNLARMAQTWGVRHSHKPIEQVTELFIAALLFVFVGSACFAVEYQQRGRRQV